MLQNYCEKEYTVSVRDADLFNLCRPSSLLNFFQDVAGAHAIQTNWSREELAEGFSATWILTRVKYELYRPIKNDEVISIRTYHRPIKGIFVYRDFEIRSAGELIGRAASCWGVADYRERTLLKAEDVLGDGAQTAYQPVREDKLGKIKMPKEMEKGASHCMGYSETDFNGHINNTRYADFACDAIHFEEHKGEYIKTLQITYSAECLPGQTIYMETAQQSGKFYVRGLDAVGQSHFDILIETDKI